LTKRDLGASVRERLLNQARVQTRPFQELLQYYAMERFLYRLSRSRHAEQFVLKGALLLIAWRAPLSRSTMDIDLLGQTSNEIEHVRALITQVCEAESEPDGIEFDANSVEAARIKEDADHEGVRVRFHASYLEEGVQTVCRIQSPEGVPPSRAVDLGSHVASPVGSRGVCKPGPNGSP
jgi:hypothetical protein